MSKSTTSRNDTLKVFFLNTYDPAWRGNANLYVALHTADPGVGGSQTTSEISYTNYARVPVVKTAAGWTIAGAQCVNAALIQFPQAGAGATQIATHWSVGLSDTGVAGQILHSAPLNTPLPVSELCQPQFGAGQLVINEG